jgi:hypothetical protein
MKAIIHKKYKIQKTQQKTKKPEEKIDRTIREDLSTFK